MPGDTRNVEGVQLNEVGPSRIVGLSWRLSTCALFGYIPHQTISRGVQVEAFTKIEGWLLASCSVTRSPTIAMLFCQVGTPMLRVMKCSMLPPAPGELAAKALSAES